MKDTSLERDRFFQNVKLPYTDTEYAMTWQGYSGKQQQR